MKVDLGNVQTLVIQLLRATASRHLLFSFGHDVAEARAFMRKLAPQIAIGPVDPNVTSHRPLIALGLTAPGLTALGVAPGIISKLDSSFREGPNPDALGDVPGSPSDIKGWWEGQFQTSEIHCFLSVNVDDPADLETATRDLRELAKEHGVKELIPRKNGSTIDGQSMGGGLLHFGYRDGFSQPTIDWDDASPTAGGLDFRNFVLGYSNSTVFSAPSSNPSAAATVDLVKDSSYAAFRWLYQDVASFNGYLEENGPKAFPEKAAADAEELLAAKIMGRWRNGTPLVEFPDAPRQDGAFTNGFKYKDQDPDGFRCPFSAHVRVVNPRDEPLDPVAETQGVPRVLRRGMPYGAPLTGTVDDGVDRGLVGVFLCTNILRQFYTLCSWVNANTFSPVYNGNRRVQDPLAANRSFQGADTSFIIPNPSGPRKVIGLPDFIQTKGTLLMLIPSRSMLDKLSKE